MTSNQSPGLPKGVGIAFMLLLLCSGVAWLFGVGWVITTVMNWLDAFPYKHPGFACVWQPEPGCLTTINAPSSPLEYLIFGIAGCIALVFTCCMIAATILSMNELARVIGKQAARLDKMGGELLAKLFKK